MTKAYLGHTARKRFGQNFLHDQNIIMDIVAAINPQLHDLIVEIGPGLGALTEPVAELVEKLTVIELDRDLAERLRHHPFLQQKLQVIQQDVLNFDFNTLCKDPTNPKLRIYGNLPYNISTPIMFHLFKYCHIIQDMFFMLQKEVVARLAATPNHKSYGRLTIMAQYFCRIVPVLEVPPTAFKPEPKVDSAIVCLIPHQEIANPVQDLKWLSMVTTKAFNQRRKTISNSLADLFSKQQLLDLDIDSTVRAENLTVAQYVQLANFLALANVN